MTQEEAAVETDWQDALQFLSPAGPPGDAPMLEVHQIWGNLIVDSREYGPNQPVVRIGDGTTTRWMFLGVDMGRVPSALRPLLATLAPLWSDFETTQRFDFRVPDGVDDGWVLFGPDGSGGFLARIPPGWDAVVEVDGKMVAPSSTVAEDGASEVRMADVSRLVVERGEFRFVARRIPRSVRVDSRIAADVDPWLVGLLCSAAMVFAGAALFTTLGDPTRQVTEQELDEPLTAMVLEVPPPPEVRSVEAGGKAEAQAKDRSQRPKPARPSDRPKDRGKSAGIFSGGADEMLGSSALSGDLVAGVGNLIGGSGTELGGNGLSGRAGGCEFGSLGCGGTAEGIGGDGLRTKGGGGDGPTSWAKQEGGTLAISDPIVIGALDKAVIDEVVKNHTAAIRYCYQRELQRSPSLAGKVAVKFTIARDGSVAAASLKSSTMGSPAVENCLVARFMRMQFPAPKGGGIVVVSYPFLFAPN